MQPRAFLPYLESANRAFDTVLETGDLDAAVPACPGWDLRRLAWHLGDVQRWARVAILEGHPNHETPDGPTERAPLRAWFAEGARALVGTLEASDPAAPVWAFGPKPATAAFWFRRQAQEASMHAYDAQQSQGAPGPIDAALALDGIDEVVRMFFPRQVRLGRLPALTASLALAAQDAGEVPGAGGAQDTGAVWLLAGDGAGDPDPAQASARVRGSAQDLLLLLWKRLDPDAAGLHLEGDEAAARAVLAAAITP